jgi:transcriptional regulator with XRE-family HTH domain
MLEEHSPDFAELLRLARRRAGLSQEELAERAGLSARAISSLERGINRSPRRDTLDMLAGALGLSADERRQWERLRRQQAVRVGNDATGEAQPGGAPPPSNLTAQPTRFFGRRDEIDQLSRMLREPDMRLVTLTGPGGSGKTRLSLQVGAALLSDFPDGVFFVDL